MPQPFRSPAILALAFTLLGVQIQCTYSVDRIGQGADSSIPGTPAISSFVANPATITRGSTAQLKGVFTAGTGVITPGNLPITSGGVVQVTPTVTTVYTLKVINPSGAEVFLLASVTVIAPPPSGISADLVEASGAEQTAAGASIANGAIVGESMTATVSAAPGLAIQVRGAFLPPDPTPPN